MKVTIKFERSDIEGLCRVEAARILNRPVAEIEVTYGATYERSVTCTLEPPEAPEVPAIVEAPAQAQADVGTWDEVLHLTEKPAVEA